ncbi:ISAs1 family transposase ISTha2 [Paraburkholderia domus]|jgi:predicted transposase YbfD/YdcC|uniref:ISAs1 family transposase ISTha2 n=1 Tax=Paraburkholderia domus TaxID=2793075 RepID=A0A9N8N970_9BURK|nr:ISAs1 family transposase [Paraburkholderia domus]MBK5065440.1 ISAs1 family transposase [Burkholderia sp. R-70199]MBK5089899.1 ISAs1 family transposase [Burkholderia sp. R-69927]MBK5124797.1 ISAs1 family transposase [Burkholderia sp. R-69980]MBK5169860.1 ISAs1 family transposase [Burkholderia sp. R-70211]MBK5179375.1 ISAs1 family transposase [Burkholderia sp. R-69749]MCI0151198.1 ISAs1 family transposase [Paraburkholderia sediminicola]
MQEDVLSIEEAFGDPRSRTPSHDLTEMLVVALCAILSGADSWVAIQTWAEAKLDWLRGYLPLVNGIASHDTFGRVFAALDAQQFEACFMRWTTHLCPALADQVVAIDGKTVRGSHRGDQRALHLVSAYGSGLGVVLGQVRTTNKSNEITAIPELFDALLLKGAIVTIDAMGCQQRIADRIIQAQADYVLAVKDNQPPLARLMRGVFDALERWPELHAGTFDEYREIEKDHGRIETRHCVAQDVSSRWPGKVDGRWPGLRSVVMIEATREIAGVASTQRRYYISSLPANACRIAHAVRSHWRIENNMHWVLDMAFGEDQCRVRVENAAQNFAILRRIAMNLLKRDTRTKAGLNIRRLKACANDQYRASLLGL